MEIVNQHSEHELLDLSHPAVELQIGICKEYLHHISNRDQVLEELQHIK